MVPENKSTILSTARTFKEHLGHTPRSKKEVRKTEILILCYIMPWIDKMAKRSEEEDLKRDMRKRDRRTYSIKYAAVIFFISLG